MSLLVQNALLPSQYQTIHPFSTAMDASAVCCWSSSSSPMAGFPAPLYPSAYIERDRQRYFDSLQSVRESGDAMPWIELLLMAVETQASDAVSRREDHRAARALPGNGGDDGNR